MLKLVVVGCGRRDGTDIAKTGRLVSILLNGGLRRLNLNRSGFDLLRSRLGHCSWGLSLILLTTHDSGSVYRHPSHSWVPHGTLTEKVLGRLYRWLLLLLHHGRLGTGLHDGLTLYWSSPGLGSGRRIWLGHTQTHTTRVKEAVTRDAIVECRFLWLLLGLGRVKVCGRRRITPALRLHWD